MGRPAHPASGHGSAGFACMLHVIFRAAASSSYTERVRVRGLVRGSKQRHNCNTVSISLRSKITGAIPKASNRAGPVVQVGPPESKPTPATLDVCFGVCIDLISVKLLIDIAAERARGAFRSVERGTGKVLA